MNTSQYYMYSNDYVWSHSNWDETYFKSTIYKIRAIKATYV